MYEQAETCSYHQASAEEKEAGSKSKSGDAGQEIAPSRRAASAGIWAKMRDHDTSSLVEMENPNYNIGQREEQK